MLSSGRRCIRKPGDVRNWGAEVAAVADDAAGDDPWLP